MQQAAPASVVGDVARQLGLLLRDRTKTYEETLRAVAARIAQAFGSIACVALLDADAGPRPALVVHHPDARLRQRLEEQLEPLAVAQPPLARELRAGHALAAGRDAWRQLLERAPGPVRSALEQADIRSLLAVPVTRSGRVVGVIAVAGQGDGAAPTGAEARRLEELSGRVGDQLWQEWMLDSLRRELERRDHERDQPVQAAALPDPALDATSDGIIGVGAGGRVVVIDSAACAILGCVAEEAVGRPLGEVIPLRDALGDLERLAPGRRAVVTTVGAAGFPLRVEVSVSRGATAPSMLTILVRPVRALDDAETRVVAAAGEYSAIAWLGRRGLEGASVDEMLNETVRMALAVFFFDRVEIFAAGPSGELVSRAIADAAVLASQAPRWHETLRQSDLREPLVIDEASDDEPATAVAVGIRLADGRLWGALAATAADQRQVERHEVYSLQALGDLLAAAIERRRTYEEMRFRALHDDVTRLPNRALLSELIQRALRARRPGGPTPALLYLCVDAFKRVKDVHGHAVHDVLLVALGQRLSGVLEAGQTLAHFGGDEFAVLCEDVRGERGAMEVAERITDALTEPFSFEELTVHARASVGIALCEDQADVDSLLRDAHLAMYGAQDRGGTRYELFDDTMRRRIVERHQIENGLRRALDNDELRLYYQPLVSVADRRIIGVEALVRWEDPERGIVAPETFIPVAESTGLIVPVGGWVLGEACRQLARWAADPTIDVPMMAVNVSVSELVDGALPQRVAERLRRTGVPAEKLTIEVTETSLMVDGARDLLQDLRDLGVQVVLDDFGSGYSSLNYLKRFPIHGLKVDQGLVGEVAESEVDRQILRAILAMGAALGLGVLVEGVETPDQVRVLAGLGCDLMQGYAFTRPARAETITGVLREGLSSDRFAHLLDVDAPVTAAGGAPAEEGRAQDRGATVTLGEAAQALGVSASTLRRWADSGRLDFVRTTGGHRRFAVTEIRRLNEEAGTGSRTVLRPLALPTEPLPALADVLAADHDRLVTTTARMLYDGPVHGWFASEAGRRHLAVWASALEGACRRAHYAPATEATRALAAEAYYGGASLLELNALVERFGDVAFRSLHEARAPAEQLVGSRRLFARLRHSALEDAERGAGNLS